MHRETTNSAFPDLSECYGREGNTEYDPNYRCWACLAVGTTIQGHALDGTRMDVVVTERPTECALCSVDLKDIPLAMHPLYDDHGNRGRQIILRQRSSDGIGKMVFKAAWCHTLCAQHICVNSRTSGCVYGCMASGHYEGANDVKVRNETRSINSDLVQLSKELPDVGIHHFVAVLPTWRGVNEWTKRVKDMKKLTCYICKRNDDRSDTVRFPVQCSANEDNEIAGRGFHKTKAACTQALHVGCAIWHKGPKGHWPLYRNVYFFPGAKERDPVVDIYCFTHAREIALHPSAWKGAQYQRFPEPNDKFPPRNPVAAAASNVESRQEPGQAAVSVLARDTSTRESPRKRYKRSSLIVPKEPGSAGKLIVEKGSPVQCPVKKGWSGLSVGPTYDSTLLETKKCCSKSEQVNPEDIYDD